MLNIEIIKFEAQDVITASTPAPECTCEKGANHPGYNTPCNHENCEYTGNKHKCDDYVC